MDEKIDVWKLVMRLRDEDTPGGLRDEDWKALLSAATIGAGPEGVKLVAEAMAPAMARVGETHASQTLLAIGGVARRAGPALARAVGAHEHWKSLGADVGRPEELDALRALQKLSEAAQGLPPTVPQVGPQKDGSLILGAHEIQEAVQEYLQRRGYIPKMVRSTLGSYAYGLSLEVDPVLGQVFVRAANVEINPKTGEPFGVRVVELTNPKTGDRVVMVEDEDDVEDEDVGRVPSDDDPDPYGDGGVSHG